MVGNVIQEAICCEGITFMFSTKHDKILTTVMTGCKTLNNMALLLIWIAKACLSFLHFFHSKIPASLHYACSFTHFLEI